MGIILGKNGENKTEIITFNFVDNNVVFINKQTIEANINDF